MPAIYEREMTITHKDFLRLLPRAISGLDYQVKARQIEIRDAHRIVRIHLSAQSSRKIGSLVLPLTTVTIELINFTQAELRSFMARFDLAYRKGGG